MTAVNIHEAKTRLSKLVEQAAAGQDVIIARSGKPVARLTQLQSAPPRKIQFGLLKGKVKIAKDFDAPMPDEALREFEGLPFDALQVLALEDPKALSGEAQADAFTLEACGLKGNPA